MPLSQVLDMRVRLHTHDAPLDLVVRALREAHGVPIRLDSAVDWNAAPELAATFEGSVAELLRFLERCYGFSHIGRDGAIVLVPASAEDLDHPVDADPDIQAIARGSVTLTIAEGPLEDALRLLRDRHGIRVRSSDLLRGHDLHVPAISFVETPVATALAQIAAALCRSDGSRSPYRNHLHIDGEHLVIGPRPSRCIVVDEVSAAGFRAALAESFGLPAPVAEPERTVGDADRISASIIWEYPADHPLREKRLLDLFAREVPAPWRGLLRSVHIDWRDVPLEHALAELSRKTGVPIRWWSGEPRTQPRVSARGGPYEAEQVLAALAQALRIGASRSTSGAVLYCIRSSQDLPDNVDLGVPWPALMVEVAWDGAPLERVETDLRALGVEVVRGTFDASRVIPITLHLRRRSLADVVEALTWCSGITWTWKEGAICVGRRRWQDPDAPREGASEF